MLKRIGVIKMEATIEVWITGYGQKVENNHDTCNGRRKYFHISIDDKEAEKNFKSPSDHLKKVLLDAIEAIEHGSGDVGETRAPGYSIFQNY